jgi:hypothetical protein
VSFPVEQATYDLLVESAGNVSFVQVKTTTTSGPTAAVNVARRPYSAGNLGPRLPYDPKLIDYFFIMDGDYNLYLLPSEVIAGRIGLVLRTYRNYLVGNARGLVEAPPGAGAANEREPRRETATAG